VYWIVNLVDMQIEVYQNPQPAAGEYADCVIYRPGQIVKLVVAPGVEIEVAVADVLPADTAIL
jgi:Uma2 family endonuclease